MSVLRLLAAFGAGTVFAVGLAISGMTRPENVVGFLDVTGDWKPELMFVMGGAILVHLLAQRLRHRLPRPGLATHFPGPPPRRVTARLLTGSALFGMGWGLAGFCPGPAVVAAPSGALAVLVFLLAMLGGMSLVHRIDAWRARPGVLPMPTSTSSSVNETEPTAANRPFEASERQVS